MSAVVARIFAIVTVLMLAGAPLAAFAQEGAQNGAQDASALIKTVVINIPVAPKDGDIARIGEKLQALADSGFVYLDLTIRFTPGGKDGAPFYLSRYGKPVKRDEKGCAYDALKMQAGLAYHINIGALVGQYHLLATVYSGDRAAFAYNDISCEYLRPDLSGFRVRGFFHVIRNMIPTAVHLQLRPFTPPFPLASKILKKAEHAGR